MIKVKLIDATAKYPTYNVYLEGSVVGKIHSSKDGYQYRPKNTSKRFWGENFLTMTGCVKSLQS